MRTIASLRFIADTLFDWGSGNFLSFGGNGAKPPQFSAIINQAFSAVNLVLFAIAPIILVVIVVRAGYMRLMAADNARAVQDSTSTLTWAVIGYIVVLAAYFIVRVSATIIGYSGIGDSITPIQ